MIIDGKEYGVLPCPFCGRRDRIEVDSKNFYEALYDEHGKAVLAMTCRRCRVTMFEHDVVERDYEGKLDVLLAKWNGRLVYGTEED